MKLRSAGVALIVLVLLAACQQAPSYQPVRPVPAPSKLHDAQPSSSLEVSRVASFEKSRGQPFGGAFIPRFVWTRLAARDVPNGLSPSDTLGRGLLVALGTSSHLTTPTAESPVAALEMLFEEGLVVSAVSDREVYRDARTWDRSVSQAVAQGNAATAAVGDSLALVQIGDPLLALEGTSTTVLWLAPPWRFGVQIPGANSREALAVARSVGR